MRVSDGMTVSALWTVGPYNNSCNYSGILSAGAAVVHMP